VPESQSEGVARCLGSVTLQVRYVPELSVHSAADGIFCRERDGHGAYTSGPHQCAEQQEGIADQK
jgi:hypothetical protein